MKAGADEAAVAAGQRTIVDQRRFEPGANFGTQDRAPLRADSAAAAAGGEPALIAGSAASVRPTNARSRGVARPVVTRASSRSQIVNVSQPARASRRTAGRRRPARPRRPAAVDRRQIGQRIGQPFGQHARAHRGRRAIEHGQQRAFAAAVADRAGDFQAAAGRFVDFQRLSGAIGDQPIDMRQRAFFASRSDNRESRRRRRMPGRRPRRRSRSLPGSACRNVWPAIAPAAVWPKAQAAAA